MNKNVLLSGTAVAVLLSILSVAWCGALPRAPGATIPATRVDGGIPATVNAEPITRDAVHTLGYTARPGSRLHFALDVTNTVTMANPAAGEPSTAPFALRVAADLGATVLGDARETCFVAWRAVRADVTSPTASTDDGRARLDELQSALVRGFDVRFDAVGVPRWIRFHADTSPFARSFVRAIVGAITFEFRPQREWSTSFTDTMGEHGFAYAATGDADAILVHRTRQFFVPRGASSADAPPPELHGSATAMFTARAGWWSEIAIDEATSWTCFGGARVAATLRGGVRLVATERIDLDAMIDDARGFVAFAEIDDDAAPPVDPMAAAWAERLAGRDEAVLLTELAALGDGGDENARSRLELVNLLAERMRQDPGAATRLGDMVQAAQLTGRVAADVLAALAIAAHPAAQQALADVFENGLVDPSLRVAAVEAMVQLERPRPELVATLQHSLYGTSLHGLGGSVMLTLGAFGSRGADVVPELLTLEGGVRAEGVEPAWFEALGNTGDPSVVPIAQRQLASGDPVERAWGLTALRRVRTAEAAAVVQASARHDPSAQVRRLAIETASEAVEPWSLDLLHERVAADPDVGVRRAAWSALLWRAPRDPATRAGLAERASLEPDAALCAELHTLLAAR